MSNTKYTHPGIMFFAALLLAASTLFAVSTTASADSDWCEIKGRWYNVSLIRTFHDAREEDGGRPGTTTLIYGYRLATSTESYSKGERRYWHDFDTATVPVPAAEFAEECLP